MENYPACKELMLDLMFVNHIPLQGATSITNRNCLGQFREIRPLMYSEGLL